MTQEYCQRHGYRDFYETEEGLTCSVCEPKPHKTETVQISLSIKALHALARRLGAAPFAWSEQNLVDLIELTLEREAKLQVIPGYVLSRTEIRAQLKVAK